jgi:uncharacterized membrane protein
MLRGVIVGPIGLPLLIVGFLLLLGILIFLVELRVLAYAYRKIGVQPRYIFGVMLLTLLGSHVNIPLYSVAVERLVQPHSVTVLGRTYVVPETIEPGATVVAVNVGGALVPVLVSIYLFMRVWMPRRMLVATALVALVVNQLAGIVPGVGVTVPMLVPPLAAAAVSLIVAFRRAPPVAYVSGSMGALIGADIANLGRLAELGAPIVSIGGAGTFDGVFLTGIIAGLLV